MAIKKQLSIVQSNRVGELFNICDALRKKKVNVLAFCIHAFRDFGVLRFVVDNPGIARQVMKRIKFPFSASDVVTVELPNVPGALAQATKKLARAGINIDYAYASAAGDKSLVVFRVSDTAKAARIFESESKKR